MHMRAATEELPKGVGVGAGTPAPTCLQARQLVRSISPVIRARMTLPMSMPMPHANDDGVPTIPEDRSIR